MATTQPNRLARDPTLPRHQEVGVDGEGYVHHLDRATNRVHRVGPAGRERVCELDRLGAKGGAAVEQYVYGYVGAQVGWADRVVTTRDLFGSPTAGL